MFSENIINLTCCTIIKMPASRLDKFSACRKDQMQVSHVDKIMVEQSSTALFLSQSIRST